jgi:hypothetical protein
MLSSGDIPEHWPRRAPTTLRPIHAKLTDDREELVRLVERVMHLAARSTQEEDDAVVMELQRRVLRAAVTDLIYPERTEASSSSKAEGMSREACLS